MNPEVAPTSTYHPSRFSHINAETCPSCGQEIPLEKLEEISGKIALREREQALAITTKIGQQYEIEKAQVVAKANDDLNLERSQSAAREALVREEVQSAAEILINEKLLEAARTRQELQASWQKQLEGAEAARKAAEQTGASLQMQIQQLRQDS